MENTVVTTVRLEQKMLRELDNLAEKEDIDRTSMLKQVLLAGIKEIKLTYALQLYQEGKISVGKTKGIAGVSLWIFLDILKQRGIGFRTDENELMRQLRSLQK